MCADLSTPRNAYSDYRSHFGSRYHIVACYPQSFFQKPPETPKTPLEYRVATCVFGALKSTVWQTLRFTPRAPKTPLEYRVATTDRIRLDERTRISYRSVVLAPVQLSDERENWVIVIRVGGSKKNLFSPGSQLTEIICKLNGCCSA